MPYYTQLGEIPPKRHIQFRRPDGALYSEEVFGIMLGTSASTIAAASVVAHMYGSCASRKC